MSNCHMIGVIEGKKPCIVYNIFSITLEAIVT